MRRLFAAIEAKREQLWQIQQTFDLTKVTTTPELKALPREQLK
jgi:hypothetical protein